jgi:hypothetical protein
VNGKEYSEVSEKTIMHHISQPWRWKSKKQSYYFCDDPECNVVYFGQDGSIIEKSDIRTPVGVKEESGNSLLCYCFGVTTGDALNNPGLKAFVINNTKAHVCECEVRNPSGKCCLKEFPE